MLCSANSRCPQAELEDAQKQLSEVQQLLAESRQQLSAMEQQAAESLRQQEAAAQAAQQEAREVSQRLRDATAQHEQQQSELQQARDSAAHLQVPTSWLHATVNCQDSTTHAMCLQSSYPKRYIFQTVHVKTARFLDRAGTA
jgi:flagellar motility protein MotE (MotC chaperone)